MKVQIENNRSNARPSSPKKTSKPKAGGTTSPAPASGKKVISEEEKQEAKLRVIDKLEQNNWDMVEKLRTLTQLTQGVIEKSKGTPLDRQRSIDTDDDYLLKSSQVEKLPGMTPTMERQLNYVELQLSNNY
mmetsp:Transcript_21751/g.33579  ORF Transcript_21751/g.33579 Transcript_21751/m.33579 type:complete len:131 (+) Transcript_21751:156-548(+)